MKMIIVLAAVLAVALAAPAKQLDTPQEAQVLKYVNDNIGVGGYNFNYETSDGVSRSEQGELKNAGTDDEALTVRGSISWTADDGEVYTLNFVADENGYRPEGAHLPKA